jgi:hypothetical protein
MNYEREPGHRPIPPGNCPERGRRRPRSAIHCVSLENMRRGLLPEAMKARRPGGV